jgi:hypothetical protein
LFSPIGLWLRFSFHASGPAAACNYIEDQKHHDRSHDCDNHAVDVEACDSGCSEQIKQKSTYNGANNSERYVQPKALALTLDDLASYEPGNQAQYDPTKDSHFVTSSKRRSQDHAERARGAGTDRAEQRPVAGDLSMVDLCRLLY